MGPFSGRDHETEGPRSPFGAANRTAARVIGSQAGVAAVEVSLDGFDAHANQRGTHARLLKEFAQGLVALRSARLEIGSSKMTVVTTCAEFGRRPCEHLSNGTGPGTSSAQILLGGRIAGGLDRALPALERLEGNGDPPSPWPSGTSMPPCWSGGGGWTRSSGAASSACLCSEPRVRAPPGPAAPL
jgi:uncharacterized protein (DUF1501 family)